MKLFRDYPEFLRGRGWPKVIPQSLDAIRGRGETGIYHLLTKVGYEGSETKKNNAYSAKLSSFSNPKLLTNEKPGITISCIRSVSTNSRAGIYETKEVGRSIDPVRLPGNQ